MGNRSTHTKHTKETGWRPRMAQGSCAPPGRVALICCTDPVGAPSAGFPPATFIGPSGPEIRSAEDPHPARDPLPGMDGSHPIFRQTFFAITPAAKRPRENLCQKQTLRLAVTQINTDKNPASASVCIGVHLWFL